jgi:predicted nucleic acid-binding protein
MRIVVSDSSCLIDLRKVSLLDALLRLPCEFLIPDTLFEDELLKFTAAQKTGLIRAGLKVIDLPGEQVLRAQAVLRQAPRLSVHDGLAFALAESHPGCILLTGDGELRTLATRQKMEVHGVLWVIDELHRHQIEKAATLLAALRAFSTDSTVRLPRRELAASIKRFSPVK